jgi:multicomponent Na+:H+ antiporter subunit G
MSSTLGIGFITLGIAFNILGCIGLIRLPDLYNRLQAATKCVTMGTCLTLVGAMILVPEPACVAKCFICMIFILVTAPTAAHALADGAHSAGVKLWENSVCDKYAEDKAAARKEANQQP